MLEQPSVASIRFTGVHGHQLLQADFKPTLNILHGKNGTGKTTLLHILANVFEGDLLRFCSIRFIHLLLRLSDDTLIDLKQNGDPERAKVSVSVNRQDLGSLSKGAPVPELINERFRQLFPKRPVYLPAFRSILEAASSREDYRYYRDSTEWRSQIAQIEAHERRFPTHSPEHFVPGPFGPFNATTAKTILSRQWFGEFVPIIRYPSLADVSAQLAGEAQRAYIKVNHVNQLTFSSVFKNVLRAMQRGIPQTKEEFALLSRVQGRLRALDPSQHDANVNGDSSASNAYDVSESSLRTVLDIYDKALATREMQAEAAYSRLRVLEESVNKFISPKQLNASNSEAPARHGPRVQLSEKQSEKLDVLSSGERQVLTMLFCATHMSEADGVMLIDEPEISLHADWQRIILEEIIKQAGSRQIIACTHAPEVVAEHRDALIRLDSTQQPNVMTRASDDDKGLPVERD